MARLKFKLIGFLILFVRRVRKRHIHSYKSSFKTKIWPVSQEYHCRWQRMGLLWQFTMLKAMNWQGWIPATYPQVGAHRRKLILCVWWDHCIINHFEFFNHNQILNADLCSQQLQRVHENFLRNRPTLVQRNVLHHNKAWPHWTRITQEKYRILAYLSYPNHYIR